MVKRSQRSGPPKPARKPDPTPAWGAQERHSGEGSASALEMLRSLEKRRAPESRPEPPPDDPAKD